jgi:hypothetical protein
VALIQALLVGVIMLMASIPAVGIFFILALILGIAQAGDPGDGPGHCANVESRHPQYRHGYLLHHPADRRRHGR